LLPHSEVLAGADADGVGDDGGRQRRVGEAAVDERLGRGAVRGGDVVVAARGEHRDELDDGLLVRRYGRLSAGGPADVAGEGRGVHVARRPEVEDERLAQVAHARRLPEHVVRHLDHQLLEPAGEPAHEGAVGVAHEQLARAHRAHAVLGVEERLPHEAEVQGDRPRRATSDELGVALDDVARAVDPRQVHVLQLQVDLTRLERRGVERAAAQPDERVLVVPLPELDPLVVGQAHGGELEGCHRRHGPSWVVV
jgi:hypothetical protein